MYKRQELSSCRNALRRECGGSKKANTKGGMIISSKTGNSQGELMESDSTYFLVLTRQCSKIDGWIRQGQGEYGQHFTPETCLHQVLIVGMMSRISISSKGPKGVMRHFCKTRKEMQLTSGSFSWVLHGENTHPAQTALVFLILQLLSQHHVSQVKTSAFCCASCFVRRHSWILLGQCYRFACCDGSTWKSKSFCVHSTPIHCARHPLRGFAGREDIHTFCRL